MEKMNESNIISFVGNKAIKSQLRQWAKQDDRSISAVIRRALENEARRRQMPKRTKVEA